MSSDVFDEDDVVVVQEVRFVGLVSLVYPNLVGVVDRVGLDDVQSKYRYWNPLV